MLLIIKTPESIELIAFRSFNNYLKYLVALEILTIK